MKKNKVVRRRRFSHAKGEFESWAVSAALIALLPMALVALAAIWLGDLPLKLRWSLSAAVALGFAWFPLYLNERIVFTLRTISSMIASLRENDYGARLDMEERGKTLDRVVAGINGLRDTLQRERIGAAETHALLEKVLNKIDVAILAFDREAVLRLANDQALALLGCRDVRPIGRTAADLGLSQCLEGDQPRVVDLDFRSRRGRFELRRGTFREQGQPRVLLVLSDLTGHLRREELGAWQRLVRVLRHEISNSLAPIQSFCQTLLWTMRQESRPPDWERDFIEGLEVIEGRAAALNRMLAAFKGLTGLPEPRKAALPVESWIQRNVALETRVRVAVAAGPSLTIAADGDQLDQLLINLLANAAEAVAGDGSVQVGWRENEGERMLEVFVEDDGPGLARTENLFVPFFTTKRRKGTGLGLSISQTLVRRQNGRVLVESQPGKGTTFTVWLPEAN